MLTWIPIHREAIHRILEYRQDHQELLAVLRDMKAQGLTVPKLTDKGSDGKTVPLPDIDPFTFLGTFNRGITDANRGANWQFLKQRWNLKSLVPEDFVGIPSLMNLNSWLFPYAKDRQSDHIDRLWQIASQAADKGVEQVDAGLFDSCLQLKNVGIGVLTTGLFWINPTMFLPADHKTVAYGKANGITTKPQDHQSYLQWTTKMAQHFGHEFPRISHEAHLFATGQMVPKEDPQQQPGQHTAYWWLNANPQIWDFEATQVGQRQTYTSHNDKGNKRRLYACFQAAKPGDIVVAYVTTPQMAVSGICKITKGLHPTEDEGEVIEIEKVERLDKPVPYETLQANPDLATCEPFVIKQGSLFRLTEQEYDIIRSLIDEANPPQPKPELYDKKKAMEELFLAEAQFDEMLIGLREKKNIVLQGPPGVGKTYVAKRLAYALMGSSDPQRLEMVQFHQSYSYEDFIQGFRPTAKGTFELRYGLFHQFCRRANRDEAQEKPYVFIIDEINRGNLSKIFGELMMLIEPDKRGLEHAMPLTYSQDSGERFCIPRNLYLIGTMNTADRSLAMVDYALRRRFRFITLQPEFSSQAFRDCLADAGAASALIDKIVDRMEALNAVIAADTKNLGSGYRIGHSYFCPCDGSKPDAKWYCRVIQLEIEPLLREYWLDNEHKVKQEVAKLLA